MLLVPQTERPFSHQTNHQPTSPSVCLPALHAKSPLASSILLGLSSSRPPVFKVQNSLEPLIPSQDNFDFMVTPMQIWAAHNVRLSWTGHTNQLL